MLKTIANGFTAILGLIEQLVNFLFTVVNSGIKLVASIPGIIKAFSAAFGVLPTVLVSSALFVLMIRLIVLIVNKKAGE